MTRALPGMVAILTLLLTGGCTAAADDDMKRSSDAQERRMPPREPTPAEELADSLNQFTFDLYHELDDAPGNLFCSPYSVSTALAMVLGGARAETEKEMLMALHLAGDQNRIHAAFGALQRQLNEYEKQKSEHRAPFELRVANAAWVQKDYALQPDYLALVKQHYDASPTQLDFRGSAEKSAATINEWVKERTGGRIPELVSPSMINDLTRLILTNAVYFKARWADPFNKEATRDAPFHLPDGKTVQTPTMTGQVSALYAETAEWQALELLYSVREMRCLILLPKKELAAAEQALNMDAYRQILESLKHQEVALWLPRFKTESTFSLSGPLQKMGMDDAFSAAADFSGINGNRELRISEVVHKTFVKVDEEGTEAAAATAVVMLAGAAPAKPIEVRVDRPFLFLIRDAEAKVILFMGRIVDPREQP